MSTLIYTANFGGRDFPHQQCEQDHEVRWLYVTDRPTLEAPEPWYTVHVRPTEAHPNLAAKWWKTHPGALGAYEHAIWIDASMEVTNPAFAREACATLDDGAPLATWKHPRRHSIYAEIEASLGSEAQGGRYLDLPLRAQGEAYRDEGYRDDLGLYACGTIVWTVAAHDVGNDWYLECEKWGYQDQVSFPVVCWRAGIVPAAFRIPQITGRNARMGYLQNRWLRIWPHTKGTD